MPKGASVRDIRPSTGFARMVDGVEGCIPVSDLAQLEGWSLKRFPEDRLAAEVVGRFEASYDETRAERTKWWPQYDHFRDGEHWLYWNELVGSEGDWAPSLMPEEMRFQTNLSKANLQDAAARMVQRVPTFKCPPLNDDKASLDAADLSSQILLHDWYDMKVGRTRWWATIDSFQYGHGIMKFGFDPSAGRPVPRYSRELKPDGTLGQVIRDKNGEPKLEGLDYDGGIFAKRTSPYSFFAQPGLTEPGVGEADWVIETFRASPTALRIAFDLGKDFEFNDEYLSPERYRLQSPTKEYETGKKKRDDGRLLVLQYHQRPAPVRGFEAGAVVTVVGNRVIGRHRAQFEDGRLPFAVFSGFPHLGRNIPVSWFKHITEINRTYNEAKSHTLNALRMAGSPNLLSHSANALPEDIYLGFQILEYAFERPGWLESPQVNPAVFNAAAQALADLDRVGGVFPVSRGQASPGITSGYHAELLKDADEIDQLPIARDHALTFSFVGESILELHRTHGSEKQLLRIAGENRRYKIRRFQREDIPAGQRVIVEEESLLSTLSSARSNLIMQLANGGMFGAFNQNPKVRRTLLKSMNDPQLTDIPYEREEEIETYLYVFDSVIDGADPETVTIEAHWDIEFFLEQLKERLFQSDFPTWNHETKQRMRKLFEKARAENSNRQQMLQQQAMAAQQQAMGMQAKDREHQTSESIRERMAVEGMKGGMSSLLQEQQQAADAAAMAAEQLVPGEGAETEPPPEESEV